MVRPKKPRFCPITGVQFVDNLYPDNKKRLNHYIYRRPDGTKKHFTADSIHKANAIAVKANRDRDSYESKPKTKGLTVFGEYVNDFIKHREDASPTLKTKAAWRNRCYEMRQFARETTTPLNKLTRRYIEDWWHQLTHSQQKSRHAEFRRLFNYMMGRGVLRGFEYNPFTTSDDRPRLYARAQPPRTRERLNISGFWAIYKAAEKLNLFGLQVAMGISLTTFMRQEDILTIRLDEDIDGGMLRRVIGKSLAKRGSTKAVRLQWDTSSYDLLRQLIIKGRELSMKNARCPYLVSHWPKQKRRGTTKDHIAQVTPKRLQEMFKQAALETKLWDKLPKGQKMPTFHEIRSLADERASAAKFDIEQIQQTMGHSDKSQTLLYQANHDLPFEPARVIFDENMLGGNFK